MNEDLIKKYRKLKKQADDAQQDKARAEGALAQVTARLKEEFDVDTLEKAEELLTQLTEEADEAEDAFEKAMGNFEKTWGDQLYE